MNKKKNYLCSVCNTQWECYIFDEFIAPFSACVYCYMDIMNIINNDQKVNETCNLCDTTKPCIKVDLANNPVKNNMFVCNDCYERMKELIREKR
ncbi:TPA: hypothetical protein HA235_07425 [Candidatus Woesearchaeota archaeon]|nr:hypothetical protein [Candidatus Woesearchaeota archaeon]HIH32508.1 hypothetical protein [Candidatus Woesearchaeota archaeon]HIH55194.1 hypothetical protein [Candidatus Woesearchaeota archaeon]HIJ01501.1 hypothetical protein [Candidatus Woesearchaeota archaeon]HIJ13483.1 hypothetical protein [Candidatus Woesearchaeota archaeon]